MDDESQISVFKSSAWAERGFCKTCGSHIFYRLHDKSYINFPLGLFPDTGNFRFNSQIFIDRKPPCYEFGNKTEMLTEKQVFERFGP